MEYLLIQKYHYIFNNKCYNICPKGNIEDNKTMTCIEVYNYTKNNSYNVDNYEKNYQDEINKYLGESANNSLAIVYNTEFTNYFIISLLKNLDNI